MATTHFQLLLVASEQRKCIWGRPLLILGCMLWLSLAPLRCASFNLDTKFVVLKKGKTPDSYFGFSVALHHQFHPERYLILTGAPRDVAVKMDNKTRTGAMYACPLTADPSDCTQVDFQVKSDPQNNIVEDMWLGVVVASQRKLYGRIMACAHRYIRIFGSEHQRRMVGTCYIHSNDLRHQVNDSWQTYNEMCAANSDLENTGMCQMGISGGFTDNFVYFGAPGAYHWQGTTYVSYPGIWDQVELSYPDRKTRHIYLGYATEASTNVLHKEEFSFIIGAPRYNHTGAVFVMASDGHRTLQKRLLLSGKQVGSYFGSSIAVADLNSDGWQDLIIGAPHYFDQKEEKGGSVYVYMNLGGAFSSHPNLTLTGPSGSSFGFSVAHIGDINKDDFQDIAIGAPYEGSGKIYIYQSGVGGLANKPQQIISGEDFNPVIKTFGYSFSGGMDVDGNSYPDLLVGTLSENILLLRARPVINILNKTFTVTPSPLDPSKCTQNSCMKVEVCFSYSQSAGDPKYKETIKLDYTVEADRGRRPPRVYFAETNSAVYKGQFSMPSKCQNLKVLLQDGVRDKLHPIAFSMKYSLSERPRRFQLGLRSLNAFPVLNEDQPRENHTEIQFQKECGADSQCNSNLQIQAFFLNEKNQKLPSQDGVQVFQYRSEVKKLNLSIKVTNKPTSPINGEDAHEALLNITFPPSLLPSSVRPSGACTVKETVICEMGNPFKRNQQAELIITFEISGITLSTQNITVQIQPSTISYQEDLQLVTAALLVDYTVDASLSIINRWLQSYFSGKVIGESAMKHEEDVGSPIELDFQVTTKTKSLASFGTIILGFEWPYEASNGKWLLYPTEILIKGNEDWYCEPSEQVINPLKLTQIDHSTSPARRKRELQTSPNAEIPITLASSKKARSETALSCFKGTSRCIWFECPLWNIGAVTNVKVRARVWNSTFIEDYNDFDRVKVDGQVTLFLRTNSSTINMKNQTVLFTVDIDSELSEEQQTEIELWVVLVAVAAGLLLLGCIILLLWKCNFFKPTRYYRIMPKYHAIRIRQEDRYQPAGGFLPPKHKKRWVTNWQETGRYY
ncbi:integrin alpha-3 [Crotalus tigris]|uniref:integrin alpha-3 n=1 Tax=Crotalus tigris TaxID=88082 RepID=UPI00192F6920|nr:integrin alpha-3 [Crotalus tigris]